MASEEERLEVARRFRGMTYDDLKESLICAYLDALGVEGYLDWAGIAHYLADLIEPEPERTCTVSEKGGDAILAGWWECSECGPVYPPCKDEIAEWALRYCPRCGRWIVDPEEERDDERSEVMA